LRWGLPLGLLLLGLVYFWLRRNKNGQQKAVDDTTPPLFEEARGERATFDDVAGLEAAKAEVAEVVEFLQHPDAFTRLGGTLPTGVLLMGPPGTGKTLLAKAVAGEAGVPFFSISGSDFTEMFVGVGARRVRDLFETAKEKAPCIVFIDEIDAVGRTRGGGQGGSGIGERDNTLNQLLVEMDGFNSEKGVIIMGATNRPDVLDAALLRPGRFDRQVAIHKPDRLDRAAIFRVHVQDLRLDESVSPERLARRTPGFAGAEIANVCNEAALLAARAGKPTVQMDDFEQAIDRVIAGLKRHTRLIAPEERRVIAHHEAGHALVGWFLEHTDPVVKVSVVPRGTSALGHARALPEERDLYSKEALLDRMAVALGGRAAEKVALGRVTTGAQDDLQHVTERAYAMVVHYGMSDRIGPLSYAPSGREEATERRPYSDAVAEAIDQEAQALVEEAQARATTLLHGKRALLDQTAEALLEHEVLGAEALTELLGAPPSAEHGEREGRSGQAETPAEHYAGQDGSSSESASSGGAAETTEKTAP
jgi:cell division protease FtsH